MTIISSEMWEMALRNTTSDTETVHNKTCCTKRRDITTTPLRKLIRKMPRVAKVVLNNCVVTDSKGKVSDCTDVHESLCKVDLWKCDLASK